MKRFWLSWYEPNDQGDYRPIKWPVVPSVLHWWCTGEVIDGSAFTLVALVEAASEAAAKEVIKDHWCPSKWRFCEERGADWTPDSGRFPVKAGEAPHG